MCESHLSEQCEKGTGRETERQRERDRHTHTEGESERERERSQGSEWVSGTVCSISSGWDTTLGLQEVPCSLGCSPQHLQPVLGLVNCSKGVEACTAMLV